MLGFLTPPTADAVFFVSIFQNPGDLPQHVVARWFAVEYGGSMKTARFAALYENLDEARADVPRHAHRFEPTFGDSPELVESWIL